VQFFTTDHPRFEGFLPPKIGTLVIMILFSQKESEIRISSPTDSVAQLSAAELSAAVFVGRGICRSRNWQRGIVRRGIGCAELS